LIIKSGRFSEVANLAILMNHNGTIDNPSSTCSIVSIKEEEEMTDLAGIWSINYD